MDLGATICTPRRPACGLCPWRGACAAHAAGVQADLPLKTPKRAKPVRFGIAWVARRADGAWLVERRPESGLLGGMLGWPGSAWSEAPAPAPAPPLAAPWHRLPGEVRHTFTHFHLRLAVEVTALGQDAMPARGYFLPAEEFRPAALPTVMRKVFDLARDWYETSDAIDAASRAAPAWETGK